MISVRLPWRWLALLLVLLSGAPVAAQRTREQAARSGLTTQLDRMAAAEDLRGRGANGIAPLLAGLTDRDAEVRRVALRGLGRLEDSTLIANIAPLLEDSVAAVRAEAANAIAQAVRRSPPDTSARFTAVDSAFVVLRSAAGHEGVQEVLAVLARSIGRLPYARPEQARDAEEQIASIAGRAAAAPAPGERPRTPAVVLHGVAHGLFSLARARRTLGNLTGPSIAVLRSAASFGGDSSSLSAADRQMAAEVRRLGWLALNAAGQRDDLLVRAGARDSDAQVRRLAVLALANAPDPFLRREMLRRAREDGSFMVRLEAVRVYRQLLATESCAPLLEAARDSNAHVRLVAIDALGTPCRERAAVLDLLTSLATSGQPPRTGRAPEASWHERAHALVSLARVDTARSRPLVGVATADRVWQMRMYAARAATAMRDTAALRRLARDSVGSVREVAIEGLSTAVGHVAAAEYVAALRSPDAHVVLAAATALKGTTDRGVASPLLDALARITSERRETSRDARLEILARLEEMMDSTVARRLASYPRDFDPVIAARAAAALSRATGKTVTPNPQRLPVAPFAQGITATGPLRLRVTMSPRSGGGTFVMRFDLRLAPASVARIVALARRGYYNGLTWHRVAMNFVIQGGSPRMNEYVGDGPFMRDEVGLTSHRRGTVGVSTRGRDTGDAQLFVNLVDNFRLDHDYTVVATVEQGMDVVDRILEGDIIDRVDVMAG